jgi:hypothetical protein
MVHAAALMRAHIGRQTEERIQSIRIWQRVEVASAAEVIQIAAIEPAAARAAETVTCHAARAANAVATERAAHAGIVEAAAEPAGISAEIAVIAAEVTAPKSSFVKSAPSSTEITSVKSAAAKVAAMKSAAAESASSKTTTAETVAAAKAARMQRTRDRCDDD